MDELEASASPELLLGPGVGKLVEGLPEVTGVGAEEEKYVEGRMMERGDLKVCARTWRTGGIWYVARMEIVTVSDFRTPEDSR